MYIIHSFHIYSCIIHKRQELSGFQNGRNVSFSMKLLFLSVCRKESVVKGIMVSTARSVRGQKVSPALAMVCV